VWSPQTWVGFGRSDKPVERSDYTYARHVAWMRAALLEELVLRDVTFLGQDWGGLVGLRLVAENTDRFSRIVIANTGLPTGEHAMSEAFLAWQRYSQETPDFKVGRIVSGGCVTPMAPEVVAAYDAPFPDDRYKAGARLFPTLVPTHPEDPAAAANRAAWEVLSGWEKPFLTAFSDLDAIHSGRGADLPEACPRRGWAPAGDPHRRGDFLQEDVGPQFAQVVAGFVVNTARG